MQNKIALSFDVEDWYHTSMMSGMYFSKYQNRVELEKFYDKKFDHLTKPLELLIEMLNKYNITATFFIVASIIEKYPKIIELLKNTKHEIASHSLYHEGIFLNKEQSKLRNLETWESEQIFAKKKLESIFNKSVIGFRAPFALFSKYQIEILDRIGFKYDSSLGHNSLFNKSDILNLPKTTKPYFLKNYSPTKNENLKIVELPWSYYNAGILDLPAGGAFFYRLLGNVYFNLTLNQCLQSGDTMFYLHPLELSQSKLPTITNLNRPFVWVNKGEKTINRLDGLLNKFQKEFVPCQDIYSKFLNND